MHSLVAQFNPANIPIHDCYSKAKGTLTPFKSHTMWSRMKDVSLFLLTNLPLDGHVRISDIKEGNIHQIYPFLEDTVATWQVTETELCVDAANHFCDHLPEGVEYRFYSEQFKCDVVWSNESVVNEDTALRNYLISAYSTPALYINSKGDRVMGYDLKHLVPFATGLKLTLPQARLYSTEGLTTLRNWEQAGKTIVALEEICKPGVIWEAILGTSSVVQPVNHKRIKGVGVYACKPLEEFFHDTEFWDSLFKRNPDLMEFFKSMTDINARNAMLSAYATKLLGQ